MPLRTAREEKAKGGRLDDRLEDDDEELLTNQGSGDT